MVVLGSTKVVHDNLRSVAGAVGPGRREGLGTKGKEQKMSSIEWGLVGSSVGFVLVAPWGWGEKA